MKRTLISAQSLRVLLNLEIATLEACREVEVGEIEVSPRTDADGCIWKARSRSMPEPGVHERAR